MYLAEKNGLKLGFNGDMTAGVETARVNLGKGDRLAFVCYLESVATDLVVTFQQHDAATSGNSKDLLVKRSYFVKAGADTSFARKEMSVESASITEADFNGAAGMVVFEVLGEDVDSDNDFAFVSLQVAARAADGCIIGELHDMRFRPAYSEVI